MLLFRAPLYETTKIRINWLLLGVAAALTQIIISLTLISWQVKQKAFPYGVFQIGQTTTNLLVSILLIVVFGLKWEGRLSGIVTASALFGLAGLVILFKKKTFGFSFDLRYAKDALVFGIGLAPATLSWLIVSGVDRFFINSMVGVYSTGLYSVGAQLGKIISLIVDAFSKAWYPFLFEKLKQNNDETKLKIVRLTYMCFAGILVLTIGFLLGVPFFLSFFVGESFHSAGEFIFWIAVGQAFNGLRYLVVDYIYYVKKTYLSGGITLVTAIMNALLNLYFIREYGAIGAAYATAITFGANFLLTWVLSAKVYRMPWFDRSVLSLSESSRS
jgi:O-antigen/teichoic acid export membrane protein